MAKSTTASDGALPRSTAAQQFLDYLLKHYHNTRKKGLYMTREELSSATGLESSELSGAMRELENAGLVGLFGRSRYGTPYVHVTDLATSTTTTVNPTRPVTTTTGNEYDGEDSAPRVTIPVSDATPSEPPLPAGKMQKVLTLLRQGRGAREIASFVYGDETENGCRKVRAIKSKLGRATATTTYSNSNSAHATTPRSDCAGVVPSQLVATAQSQPIATQSQPSLASHDEVVRAPVAGLGSRVSYVLETDVVTVVLCDADAASVIQRLDLFSSRV